MEKKALVISGGGAYGSFAGGVAEHLIANKGIDYDIVLGTSTGSLLAPFLSLGDVKTIKEAYLNVSHSDIFSFSPYKTVGMYRGKLKPLPIFWNMLRGQRSLGDSSALEGTIKKHLTEGAYQTILKSGKIVGCCVTNITSGEKEYKYMHNYQWQDYVEWMHASCAVPPIMSVVEKEGALYADGGILEKTPLQEAICLGATSIDAVILNDPDHTKSLDSLSSLSQVLHRIISMMMNEISKNDILIAKLQAKGNPVKIRFYDRGMLVGSPMVFHPKSMKINWSLGYIFAEKEKYREVTLDQYENKTVINDDVS